MARGEGTGAWIGEDVQQMQQTQQEHMQEGKKKNQAAPGLPRAVNASHAGCVLEIEQVHGALCLGSVQNAFG